MPVPPKTRTNCSLNVTDLARPGGLIISFAFVTGWPEAVKPVKSSARM